MKKITLYIITLLMVSCASIQRGEHWKNPEVTEFNPKNVLVVGVTPDFDARSNFEFVLVQELNKRNINAIQSTVVFEKLFQDATKTEADIEAKINTLLTEGFETVLVSAVKGVQENESRSGASPRFDYSLQRFLGGYLASRDDYFSQEDYKKYQVFYVETTIYRLQKDEEKSLVWLDSYNIINPENIAAMTDDYVKKIIKSMEKEKLIPKKKALQ
ncbi:hypothetical protein C8N46_103378 [Kordia periserrulae]|uniref:Uncharacterized protein n=1 Tax=Kordia periserrulae TaxID=701523 RepID=A0A2T6C1V7_9FLAO|nr:hypothetical protein [Kordia periserrulae]PTX62278.1 hypothetical protein C8N46_103378 [Kordia periserrulae]